MYQLHLNSSSVSLSDSFAPDIPPLLPIAFTAFILFHTRLKRNLKNMYHWIPAIYNCKLKKKIRFQVLFSQSIRGAETGHFGLIS